MTTPPDTTRETTRKINQLDNDVHAIYDLLKDISKAQKKHDERFDALRVDLNHMGGAQLRQNNRFDEFDERLTGVDGQLTTIAAVQLRQANRLDEFDGRLVNVEGKLDTVLDILRGGPAGEAAG